MMKMGPMDELAEKLRSCPSKAPACRTWTYYDRLVLEKENLWPAVFPASAQHPLLFDHPASQPARIMLIGASPGPGGDPSIEGPRGYVRKNNNESPLARIIHRGS